MQNDDVLRLMYGLSLQLNSICQSPRLGWKQTILAAERRSSSYISGNGRWKCHDLFVG